MHIDVDAIPKERRMWEKSIGSALHATGEGVPCTVFATKEGCASGVACRFCHLHPRCNRPSNRQRARQRARKEKEAAENDCCWSSEWKSVPPNCCQWFSEGRIMSQ